MPAAASSGSRHPAAPDSSGAVFIWGRIVTAQNVLPAQHLRAKLQVISQEFLRKPRWTHYYRD
ncbi:hypothetical protein GBP346_A2353 [Burkholderia pseudomallei MSHR346]|nr:hypothetical protein GBP346_A2353 [Burkholderia pseudomallei MSHR346]